MGILSPTFERLHQHYDKRLPMSQRTVIRLLEELKGLVEYYDIAPRRYAYSLVTALDLLLVKERGSARHHSLSSWR